MTSSLVGSLIFIAAYIGMSFFLFGWNFRSHGAQYALTFVLFLVVTEALRLRAKRTSGGAPR